LQLVKEKKAGNGDFLLVKGKGERMEATINNLLHYIPSGRLIVQKDSKTVSPAGVGRSVDLTRLTKKGDQ
jgi:hypothetical protein